MGVFLGGLSSLFYGVADFLGGEGAKRVSSATVVLWASLLAFPLIAITAFIVGGDPTSRDLWLGALGGSLGVFGLVTLFAGLGRGQAAAVAPASAISGGLFPVLVALVLGENLKLSTWIGVALALPAIVLCSWVADRGEVPLGGVWYGLAAGVGFGAYTVILDQVSPDAGLFPLIPSRGASILVIGLLAVLGVWRVTGFETIPRRLVFGNGLLDYSGNVALLLALQAGDLAPVAVASSFYPAVTVLMARLVNREHLRGRQIAGLVLTLVALAAIAIG